MIKNLFVPEENSTYFYGFTKEIKAMYKSLKRNSKYFPLFSGDNKFSENKETYAIMISENHYVVLSGDIMLKVLLQYA